MGCWLDIDSDTHCEHILCKSLSVVPCCKPLMYKFVFNSCSVCLGVMLGPIVLFVLVLLKLVLNAPLCNPVFEELLELVLLGEAAVGTRCPYCKEERMKRKRINFAPTHNERFTFASINQVSFSALLSAQRWR